jgi:hypothetical protein
MRVYVRYNAYIYICILASKKSLFCSLESECVGTFSSGAAAAAVSLCWWWWCVCVCGALLLIISLSYLIQLQHASSL